MTYIVFSGTLNPTHSLTPQGDHKKETGPKYNARICYTWWP